MAFDESGILVELAAVPGMVAVAARWSDARAAGTWYQVYVDGRLAAETQAREVVLPWPPGRSVVRVGAVLPADLGTPMPPSPPSGLGDGPRPSISWSGGPHQRVGGRPVARWDVYRSLVAGGAVSYAAPVGSIASASGGGRAGGWGSGGWGSGGWGRAARRYRFVDLDRPSGLWAYGVVPVNDLGESGSASEAAVRVEASPRGPGVIPGDPHGRRARIQVDSGAPMLRWGHSPDYVGPPPAGQDEIQRITTSGGGGFGTLTVGWYGGGNGTTTLNSGDSAATIAAKLGTIAGLAGNVTVAGGPLNAAPVDVRFTGALASTAIDESTDGLTIVLATAFASASIDVVQQGSAP